MAASKVQLNVTGVQFATTSITRVTSFSPDTGGSLIKFKGDADIYPVIIACADIEPTCSITTADIGTIQGISPGANGTIVATMNDATGATGGAINWTLANAVFRTHSPTQGHAQFGSTTAHFDLFSSDGITSPISFTRS